MQNAADLGMLTAFLAGVVSFLSPCVLPLVPAYLSYVAGESLQAVIGQTSLRARLSTVGLSAFFCLGFSTIFVALGASATALGQLLARYRYEANIVGGAIVILFGLLMLGLLRRFTWLQRDARVHVQLKGGHPLAAYGLGFAFGFGWTPCVGPVLGAILTVSAVSASASRGVALLSAYSLGLAVPFLGAALFVSQFLDTAKVLRKVGYRLQAVAGAILVAFGVAILTGQLTAVSAWLLRTFPALGSIG